MNKSIAQARQRSARVSTSHAGAANTSANLKKSANANAGKKVAAKLHAGAAVSPSLSVRSNAQLITQAIAIVAEQSQPVEIRRAALSSLSAINFDSSALNALMPVYRNALWQLLSTRDAGLVNAAVEILASYDDERIQKILVDGLRHPAKALVPVVKAIQLLGIESKPAYYPVIRNVLAHSNDTEVMIEAITALSGDPASRELIRQILMNKNTDKEVQMQCIAVLTFSNPQTFRADLKTIITDDSLNHDVRAAAFNTLVIQNNYSESAIFA